MNRPGFFCYTYGSKNLTFVGVTTPTTIRSANPKTFLHEEGEFVYSFLQQDETGEALYSAIQQTVDDVRAQGAKYVILLGHLGNNSEDSPWSYSDVISHTNGIDVLLDRGGGDTAFDGCEVLQKEIMLDNEALIGYITKTLGGVVGEEYENPYGQGRIVSVTAEE